MSHPLNATFDELRSVIHGGDLVAFQRIFTELATDGRRWSPDELTAAVGELAQILAYRPEGVFARLALAAGAFVEWGASPVALAANAPACALATMHLRLAFSQLWPAVADGRPDPDPNQPPTMDELVSLFTAAAPRLGIPERAAAGIALSWFDVNHWVALMITVMARREFRDAADLLDEIGEVAARLGDSVTRAHWLPGLAQVLDDEPIIVIDHATGRGFRLTISGLGDNYQLHTLLADRLIGDPAHGLLPGERPEPTWVAAATTGPPQRPTTDLIQRRFRLFDGTGAYQPPEGRPADIALLDGVRVIVLHPPSGNYGWTGGRTYEHMVPTLTLDRILPPDEARAWQARIAPARETDLFGINRT